MYSWIFEYFYDKVKLTDNLLVNIALPIIIYAVLHKITFKFVGDLYKADFIDGSFAGKIAYLLTMFVNILITIGLLFLVKAAIWLYGFVQTLTLLNWISIVGVFVLVIGLIVSIRVIVNKRQEGEKI